MIKKTRQELQAIAIEEVKSLEGVLVETKSLVPQVLRFHLLTEQMLDRLIASRLHKGHILLDQANITYYQKVLLAQASGWLEDEEIGCLRKINQLRNSCAHDRTMEISLGALEEAGRPLGKAFAKIRAESKGDVTMVLTRFFRAVYIDLLVEVLRAENEEE